MYDNLKEAPNAKYGCDLECCDRNPVDEYVITVDEELDYINGEVEDGYINEDPVNHPNHYIQDGIETIDVIKAWTKGLDGIIATDTGNIIKYISRWNKKNGIEDLKKAQWYLNHLIKEMEERMENDCCC
jgi:hypothetical protein